MPRIRKRFPWLFLILLISGLNFSVTGIVAQVAPSSEAIERRDGAFQWFVALSLAHLVGLIPQQEKQSPQSGEEE